MINSSDYQFYMVSRRDLDKRLALEKVQVLFYNVIEKDGKKLLKPLSFDTKISLKLVRAILDDTVIPTFYDTLSKNLIERGVEPGSHIQLRVKFNETHALVDPVLVGTRILCDVKI